MADLCWVLQKDYTSTIRRLAKQGQLPLRELEERARALFPEFNRAPLQFSDNVRRVADPSRGLGVRLRMSAYGKAGHPLRGFYHQETDRGPLIWVNMRHTPTAMAATFAHEVGHVLWNDVQSERRLGTQPFYNADFATHLRDPGELFADAFTTMAAYPTEVARRLFTPRGWPRLAAARGLEEAAIADVYSYLRQHYAAELGPGSGLPPVRRFHYLASMIHFAKIRAAILHTVGM